MNNFLEEYLMAADADLENLLMSHILVRKTVPEGAHMGLFTGNREGLFLAVVDQIGRTGCLDYELLKRKYRVEIESALDKVSSYHPDLITELQKYFQMRQIARLIFGLGRGEIGDFLRQLQEGTGKILLQGKIEKYFHHESVAKLSEIINKGQSGGRETAGWSTGLTELDKATSGIEKGKMYVIGALKKTGKSRFSIFLSLKLHEQGAGVMWNSLEMNDLQLNSCALAYYADIDARYIGRRMPDQEFVKLNGSLGKLNDLNWMISREKNVFDLRARIIQLRSTRTVDVVFVDYIQRMEDSNYSKDRTRETEALSKGLADLSRDLNVAIVVLSQLAGRAENLGKDEMPNMSHMKESQGIAEAADCIITLHNFARRDNPVNADGSYKLAEIYALIEQRYDVSGCRFRFLGDLRTCNFLNHVDPYGEPNV